MPRAFLSCSAAPGGERGHDNLSPPRPADVIGNAIRVAQIATGGRSRQPGPSNAMRFGRSADRRRRTRHLSVAPRATATCGPGPASMPTASLAFIKRAKRPTGARRARDPLSAFLNMPHDVSHHKGQGALGLPPSRNGPNP
jgi:hypothetical protein